jgi:hypothetical protein
MDETMTKKCKYCASDIPIQAIQCSVCKNYQNKFRNNLLFVGGLSGFIALFGSALSFSANQVAQLYKRVSWRDNLTLLELQAESSPLPNSPNSQEIRHRVIVSNDGDGPVFAHSINVDPPSATLAFPLTHLSRFGFSLNRLVNVNSIVLFDNTSEIENKTSNFAFVTNKTGKLPDNLLHSDIPRSQETCFYLTVFNINHSGLKGLDALFRRMEQRLVTYDVPVTFSYLSVHSSILTQTSVMAKIFFKRSNAAACQNISFD